MAVATLSSSTLLPRTVTLALLMGGAVLSAQLTWLMVEPDLRPAVSIAIDTESAAVAEVRPEESPLAAVAELPLFGELVVRTEPAPVVAPETRLRLRLVGLVAGDSPEQGRAIIAEGGGSERLYAVGDTIADQARLHQIHSDRVILERAGALETLRLPRADGSPSAAGSPAPSPRAADLGAADLGGPSLQRSEWLQNPDRLLQSVQARPVIRSGELYGLEIRPTRNARQFQQAGLRPGDVITSVNGVPLSAIEDPENLLQDLAVQNRVDLVLERGGQAMPLSIQLTD